MSRSQMVSVTLLTAGGGCIVAGLFGLFGLWVGLLGVGALLIAAEFLVPGR